MSEQKKYLRFCDVCKRTTYEWKCCGRRTRTHKMQNNVPIVISKREKLCPKCFLMMNKDSSLNSISHDGKTEICSLCGRIASLEKFRPDLAEGLKVAQKRAQAVIYGLDDRRNPRIPKEVK